MKKYQITISFTMDDDFMSYIPEHRIYLFELMSKNIIETYAVSLESFTCWILINAASKKNAKEIILQSPLSIYWHEIKIDELFVYDNNNYREGSMSLN
jgi:hypothetical protein